ncbi:MAG: SDR family NAD(P)-dependent oxidoreductase [Bacteroidaceae bacterium]|nr:SDR family NAD(P)-dependent oxidoreductase [Bacteroidaceae bacterium]
MKKVIIVGATSGIGQEVARQLHSEGCTVGIAGRRADRLEQMKAEWGERVFTQRIDVCSEDAESGLLRLIEQMGGVDVVLLSAGIGKQNPPLSADIEMAGVATNAMGFTRMIGAAYRYFAANGGGHIACISSIAGTKGLGASPAYSATKRFQSMYVQCLAQHAHMFHHAIKFTDIRPGFVDTELLEDDYPIIMPKDRVAKTIVKALRGQKRVVTIDWRFRLLVFVWRLIPDCIWERMTIKS